MGYMKDLYITIHRGGEEAVAAVQNYLELQGDISDRITDAFAKQRWIPVEERVPDRYIRVLAFVKCEIHEHPHVIGFVDSTGLWPLDELHEESAVVTHWMPLPEPPEVK